LVNQNNTSGNDNIPTKKKDDTQKGQNWYKKFLMIDLIVLVLSIIIPLILVSLNQASICDHHIEDEGGGSWLLGRALGFTTLIWFIFTSIKGARTKKIAKIFHSYPKAKNYHCLSAFLTNAINFIHFIALLASDTWGPLILEGESNHMPLGLFLTKFWTGVAFGIIMIITSLMFYYLRDIERLKKFGYKRFIKVHHIMLLATIILSIHIFLINTEILVLFWG